MLGFTKKADTIASVIATHNTVSFFIKPITFSFIIKFSNAVF